jgi:hypothetical protein
LLLPATLQIPRVVGPHVGALEVSDEDLFNILPTIDRVSGQVIEPSPSRVSYVNGEELDDEEIILCPAYPAHEIVILQSNTGIGFAIILDDIIRCLTMLRETCVAHVAPEWLGLSPLRAKPTPFLIATPTAMWVACMMLGACPLISPASLMARRRLRVSAWAARPEMGWG